MNKLFKYIQENMEYSDYEIAMLKYQLTAFSYDISKLVIMAILFFFLDLFPQYCIAVITLLLLRTTTGGLHFKTYIGCLLFTLCFFITAVSILPQFKIHQLTIIILLYICILIVNIIGPITSNYRPIPNGILIKKCKRNAGNFIFLYSLFTIIIPLNQYIITGFWVIILQTLQLVFAYIHKKRR